MKFVPNLYFDEKSRYKSTKEQYTYKFLYVYTFYRYGTWSPFRCVAHNIQGSGGAQLASVQCTGAGAPTKRCSTGRSLEAN